MAASNLSYQFKTANVLIKLIVINVAVFIVVRLLSFFMQVQDEFFPRWFMLPDSFGEWITQPWSILSYSFLHGGIGHIFWNMLVLYMFGRILLNLFSEKRFLTIYLLGAVFGGLLYMLAYNIFPVFVNTTGYLVGASASVRAIMIFMAAYAPNNEIRVFRFNIKLWHIGVFVIIVDLLQLSSGSNSGGMLAHLGGALFGYLYAKQLAKGNDIGIWFERIMDWVANLFTPREKNPFKKVHRNKTTQSQTRRSSKKEDKTDHQKKIDTILDKIGKSGYESLSKAEKDFLFKSGKND